MGNLKSPSIESMPCKHGQSVFVWYLAVKHLSAQHTVPKLEKAYNVGSINALDKIFYSIQLLTEIADSLFSF